MLAVNGAVRVVVVARKLMMSTVSYIHTWHTRWLTGQFEDLKICEWIRRPLLTVYSQCMEKLIFSFPEAAQAKDKYQIINETLELKLAFFSVFFFFWSCWGRKPNLGECVKRFDSEEIRWPFAWIQIDWHFRELNIINYRIVGLVESSFIHMCDHDDDDDDDVHLLICSINLALTMNHTLRPRAVYP